MSGHRQFTVKVQLSLFTNAGAPQMLVYNESQSVRFQGDASPDVVEIMGERPKAFFEASLDAKGLIHIGEEVGDPGW